MTSIRKIKRAHNAGIKGIIRESKHTFGQFLLRHRGYDKLPANFPNTCVNAGPIIAPEAYKHITTRDNDDLTVLRVGLRTQAQIKQDQMTVDTCATIMVHSMLIKAAVEMNLPVGSTDCIIRPLSLKGHSEYDAAHTKVSNHALVPEQGLFYNGFDIYVDGKNIHVCAF